MTSDGAAPGRVLAATPRWSGQHGKLEVWYATFTDQRTGTGVWIHHETVSRPGGDDGRGTALGWVCLFPPDRPPVTERFGPVAVSPQDRGDAWFAAAGATAADRHWSGKAGTIDWDLVWDDPGAPHWTFDRRLWERELLPSSQVVVAPTAGFTGTIRHAGGDLHLEGARGAVSHIFGHGNAKKWAWLHADLGGGDVLEVVTAVSMRPGLDRLLPLAFIRFRLDGAPWPASPLPALRVRTTIDPQHWECVGRIGARRIRIHVDQPAQRCVSLDYVDPDGGHAVCTNTERADLDVTIDTGRGAGRRIERHWHLDATAHSEVGLRGDEAPPVNERRPGDGGTHP